uniref:CCHC-type domain-containing protein n=1 Tax=Varanus komodoensis TaxID=61221 RepID=A0A8D2IPZ9_VARKO
MHQGSVGVMIRRGPGTNMLVGMCSGWAEMLICAEKLTKKGMFKIVLFSIKILTYVRDRGVHQGRVGVRNGRCPGTILSVGCTLPRPKTYAASDTRDPRKRFVVRFRYIGTDPNRDTRAYLTKTLMREVLKIEKEQVVAVIQLPGSRETDVCLASELAYWKFWAKCKAAQRANPSLLEGFEVTPLFKDDTRILTVIFRTTTIPEEDVARWVSRYAVILNGPYKRIDEEGFWTGEYRCVVSFKNQSQDNRQGKIPKYFFLGAERGITRYSGQPSACYHCGSYEHYRRTCTTQLCSRCCGKGHSTLACQRGIRCNLCEEAGHTYYWCPQAYYNRQDAEKPH